jgi:hypothetical protein
MPLPLVDIHTTLNTTKDETMKKRLLRVISEIEEIILSHHSSKSKFTQKGNLSLGGQFSFYVLKNQPFKTKRKNKKMKQREMKLFFLFFF